ncbi:hypothetical protein [Roseivivax sediminis]|uniref:Uncharacterized protein n=1 Tax=Roseivivax sediminis TaxID=936889 RepID=A0A1I2C424_9RHOB|nr:hypothetical protein [Roseivivax sediminis]SFE63079.1 hypothetical protein SAMN04515678_112113 [Roseivivax sediminis]
MFADNTLTDNFRDVRAFILAEREKTVSDREWSFRLRGYGYRLNKTERGYEVARLSRGEVLGVIDA